MGETRDERPDEGIFPTFFMAGFECSTFIWKDDQRKDYVALTGHDRHLRRDYECSADLGIGTLREGIRWPLVDRGRRYDWSTVQPVIDAANEYRMGIIWDLCHYGFPDGFDLFSPDAPSRFADYCRAAAQQVTSQHKGAAYFTPVNEITFFSGAATDMGWMYPFAKGRSAEMKEALCRMSIAGARAIREVAPQARMVHVDPLIYEVPKDGRPETRRTAWEDTYEKAFEAWDMLFGRLKPELGGSQEILDVVGVNIYSYCEAQVEADGRREALSPSDPRRKPLNELLRFAWDRYHRPIIIGETSGAGDGRPEWLKMVMQESLIATNDGVDLQGVCLFPCVDMPDWQTGKWANIGIFDIQDGGGFERSPCQAYVSEIRRWQDILGTPPSRTPEVHAAHPRARIADVRRKAHEWEAQLRNAEQQEHAREREAA